MTTTLAAAVVTLCMFGQPLAATWGAIKCQHRDAARAADEGHCRDAVAPVSKSTAITADALSCHDEIAIATAIIERVHAQCAAPAPAARSSLTICLAAHTPAVSAIYGQGPLRHAAVPLRV